MATGPGSPEKGDQPGFGVDTATGTQITRYSLVQISTSTSNMQVGLYSTSNPTLVVGTAFTSWPYVPQTYSNANNPVRNISTYDTTVKNRIAVKQEGYSWFLVKIPANGATEALKPGDYIMPSVQYDGSVTKWVAPASGFTNDTFTSALIIADLLSHAVQSRKKLARIYSVIHIPATTQGYASRPAMGQRTMTTSLARLVSAVTYGYVFGKFLGG